ncbi:hypothetical protein Lfu02_59100 [Longispora fulva]|uniref:Uncharacterized protein n=1 Tax=Longispora fulva TaxID=619741 RepID=A0A8J7GIL4_9ACTN|nr:DUF6328 family protein [Longispora fulva]MBG6137108.1 hypothetical protein [Longispora fulva]GIG61538.1 hypothetical protein Lfu02_59100 [Longispora fulva]
MNHWLTHHPAPRREDPSDHLTGHPSELPAGPQSEQHDQWNLRARGETPTQRLDRNYSEILQEVRVAQTGVQLLLAFLLALAFTPRFGALTDFERSLYVASLILGAAATALLIAPAPFHRLLFQRRLKEQLVRACALFVQFGLALLMLSLSASMLLILDVVLGTGPAAWITAGTLAWFCLWWYAVPLWSRARHGREPGSAGRPQPGLPGDVDPRVHPELRQDVRDMGADRPWRQE